MLVLAAVMIGGGCWLLFEQLTISTIISARVLTVGGVLVFVGLVLLWEDFIAPLPVTLAQSVAKKPQV